MTHRRAMIQVLASFMSNVPCDVQCLLFFNLYISLFISQERIFDNFVTTDSALIDTRQNRSILIDKGIVSMISSENCMLHWKPCLKFFTSLWISKNSVILSLIIVFKPRRIISHGLNDKYRLSSYQITCTCDHMVHSQCIVGLLPYSFRFSQSMSSHHDKPES